MNLNKQMLIGRVGQLKEQKFPTIYKISVATNSSYKDKKTGEWMTETEWHTVNCFGDNIERALKLSTGDQVYVEGKTKTSKWKDKNGMDRESKEIMCNVITGLTKKENTQKEYKREPVKVADEFDDDEIPF